MGSLVGVQHRQASEVYELLFAEGGRPLRIVEQAQESGAEITSDDFVDQTPLNVCPGRWTGGTEEARGDVSQSGQAVLH